MQGPQIMIDAMHPDHLPSLTYLSLRNSNYNLPITNFPPKLIQLELGYCYKHPIKSLPPSLI